jgi:hypothetical protein
MEKKQLTDRENYHLSQAKLLAERNTQKVAETPVAPECGPLTPKVGKDTTKSSSEAHPSRAAAKRAVRHHLAYPCWKCDLGRRIDWFVCPVASGHLHIGHGPLKEAV